jgi:hypothetical protein
MSSIPATELENMRPFLVFPWIMPAPKLTDADLRGQALKLLYDHRDEELTFAAGNDGFPIPNGIEARDWLRACEQLAEKSLIHWTPLHHNRNGRQHLFACDARINGAGIDIVEGTSTPPIAIHIDQSQSIAVHESQGVQIAGANSQQQQTIGDALQNLIHDIDASPAAPEDKQEAKSRLKTFLESKVVVAVLGPLAGVVLKKLFD